MNPPASRVRPTSYGALRAPPPPDGRRIAITWALWLAVLAAVTLVMFAFRSRLDKAHVALGFLIVVLGGSAAGGRVLGLGLAGLGFFLLNFVFLTPYYTLIISN